MTERTVSVKLRADIRDYVRDMDKAAKATRDFGAGPAGAGKQLQDFAKRSENAAARHKAAFADFGKVTAGAGIAIGAAVGLAVKSFADFDKEMSNVRAVSGATAAEMGKLTDAALDAGARTKFSASDAAQAESELAKAGISTADILGGALTGALSLAAAGNLDLSDAATTSSRAMKIFNLSGQDVGHIADVLAAGANKSAADISDLGQALQQGGLVAQQTGLKLEDTVGVLSAFADNALIGSDAGTSLKTMLQRLVPSSDEAATAMKDIGFSAYDAQGNFVGLQSVADQLQKGLGGLTQQQRDSTLATIFGSDAVRAANVLYKLGARGVEQYTTAVNDQGAAARVAAIQMDNLAGDMENLRGSIETALIKGGSGANDSLRGLAQGATDAVNAFSDLPDSVQSGVVQLAALSSGVLLLGGGLATAIPKIKATKDAIDAMTLSGGKGAAALGLLGRTAAVVSVAAVSADLAGIAAAASVATPETERLAKGLTELSASAQESKDFGSVFATGMGVFRNDFEKTDEALKNFGENAKVALDPAPFDYLSSNASKASAIFDTRVKQIDAALVQLVQSGHAEDAAKAVDALANSTTQFGGNAQQVRDQFSGYKAAVEGAAIANGQYADSTQAFSSAASGASGPGKLLSDQIEDQQKSAENAAAAYDKLTASVKNFGSEVNDALSANSDYEQAVDDAAERTKKRAEIQAQIAKLTKADAKGNADEIARLKEELEGYAKTLDLGTDAGRRNIKSLQTIASSAKEAAVANFDNGASFGEVAGQMDNARQKFIDQAIQFGATSDQAKFYADNLGLTRENLEKLRTAADVKKTVTADTAQADTDLHSITRQLEEIDGKTAKASVQVTYERVGPSLEAIAGLANGTLGFKGFDIGGYTGNMAASAVAGFVHGKEFVFDAPATARLGVGFLESLRTGGIYGFQGGGYVPPRFADRGMISSAMSTTNQYGGNVTNDRRISIGQVVAADVNAIEREADRRRRLDSLGTRRRGS